MGASWQEPRQPKRPHLLFHLKKLNCVKAIYRRYVQFNFSSNDSSGLISLLRCGGFAFPGAFPEPSQAQVLTQTFLVKINTAGDCIKLDSMLPYMDIPVIHG